MSTELVMSSNHLILSCPLLLLPSIFPSIGPVPMSWFFPSGGQSIGASPSASFLPINIQDWFSLGGTGWISLLSKGLSNLLQHHSLKASIFWCSAFFMVQFSHLYMITGKIIALPIQTLVSKVMSLLFNMLSRFVICHCLLQCLRFNPLIWIANSWRSW